MDRGNEDTKRELSTLGDEYLWDGSGTPDPEIQKLEMLLARYRHQQPAPAFPAPAPARRRMTLSFRGLWLPALAGATLTTVVIVAALVMRGWRPGGTAAAGWDVSRVSGAPRIGRRSLSAARETATLGVGQTLVTDLEARASMRADAIGQIDVDPGTRLRLLNSGSGLKRLALDRGTIHAYIWAPPGQFGVDTPSAVAVDLGCAYTLQVDDAGAGLVRTSLGWVGFKLEGRESFIPAGAACATRPKVGPGTPYFEDAPDEMRAALARFDFTDTTCPERGEDLRLVLKQARPRDRLTLWHLLARADESQRASVYERLARFNPPPAGVTREGVLHLDQAMLDRWWNQLGFDHITVWRFWERSWKGAAPGSQYR